MVKIIGRVHGGELAYKVMAAGYSFEVSVFGRKFRIKHVPAGESKLPVSHLASAFEEVRKFIEARGAAVAASFMPAVFS